MSEIINKKDSNEDFVGVIRFIGAVNIGNIKRDVPAKEVATQKLEEKYEIKFDDDKYSVVQVPNKWLGNSTFALFEILQKNS